MNKPMSLALLVIGAILLFYGLKAGDSVSSDVCQEHRVRSQAGYGIGMCGGQCGHDGRHPS